MFSTLIGSTLLLLMSFHLKSTRTQYIEIQNLNENNGYITLKTGQRRIIHDLRKSIHIINITEFESNTNNIRNTISVLGNLTTESDPSFLSMIHNFNILQSKLNGLKPHIRHKRGLINVIGKGLKIITGTMDSDDETLITKEIENLSNINHRLVTEANSQISINTQISEQIKNISRHINNQQKLITQELSTYTNKLGQETINLKNDLEIFRQIFQVNYDITLLRNHIDDIEQIILSSRLNILSRNILSEEEIELISDIEAFKDIRVTVACYGIDIVIIVFIPIYSNKIFYNLIIEPIPTIENKTLSLEENTYLMDENKLLYSKIVKDNLKRNLIKIENGCLNKIVKSENATCKMEKCNSEIIKEISPGLLIIKNNQKTSITQNCNNENLKLFRNSLIKFENCKLLIENNTYTNAFIKIKDHVLFPHYALKIVERKKENPIDLKELHLNNIKMDRKEIEEFIKNNYSKTSIFLIALFTLNLITVSSFLLYKFCSKNTNSSEPRTNDGGVICSSPTVNNVSII